MTDINAPTNWTRSEYSSKYQARTQLRELRYRHLESDVFDVLEQFLSTVFNNRHVEKVKRHDMETAEVVFSGSISNYKLKDINAELEAFFGPTWRAERKPDDSRSSGVSEDRVLVRCVECQRFRYHDESDDHYEQMRVEPPDGVPDGASHYGDLEQYEAPSYVENLRTNLYNYADAYYYQSNAGTWHLLETASDAFHPPGRKVRETPVDEDLSTVCSIHVPAEELAEGDRVSHYADLLRDPDRPSQPAHDLLGDDLCGMCAKSVRGPEKTLYGDFHVAIEAVDEADENAE